VAAAHEERFTRKRHDASFPTPSEASAGDAGGAVGAALAAFHIYEGQPRSVERPDSMMGSYRGPEYYEKEILKVLRRYKATFEYKTDFQDLCTEVAELLASGKIVGWFQGRMEMRTEMDYLVLGNFALD